ncbi:uncharacterized protein LOC121447095 [Microtus oregoni]|uniref:uncharacterized protein LOC121447095 n=1 Tax=Microtus oregoni TaxID=111838 RepID=UPI001BB1B8B7|nr:uncharacterized protein LOC121447095 [Microtus oregoni]
MTTLTLATENTGLRSGVSHPRSGERLRVQTGSDLRDRQRREETPKGTAARKPRGTAWGRGPSAVRTALTRGPGGVAQCGGSSRPAAAAARVATHHATALMAGPGGPGSARFRSARSGRAGIPEAAAQQKREPNATAWTAEWNDPGTGHGEVKAQLLRTSGRDTRGFREKVREDTGGFSRYRSSKNLAVLGEETALTTRLLNQDLRERCPGREKPAPTGRREGHAASQFVRLRVKTFPMAS